MKYSFVLMLLIGWVSCQNSDELVQFRSFVAAMVQKISEPAPIQGKPFPKIQGPKCKNSAIGIVGAGPGGIDMAFRLKRAGYTNVTILEATNRIGGKSNSVEFRGVSNTLSTVLMTPNYEESMIPLLKEFGLFNVTLSKSRYQAENNAQTPSLNPLELLALRKIPLAEFSQQVAKYCEMHRNLFGTYQGYLMNKPLDLSFFHGSFKDFLLRNGMEHLLVLHEITYQAAGYGSAEDVGSFQGLQVFTPRVVIRGILNNEVFVLVTEMGFHSLFERMVQDQDIDIKFNYKVENVKKRTDGTFELSSRYKPNHRFDFLIWSGLMRDFPEDSDIIRNPRELDLLRSNKPVFAAGSVVNMQNAILDSHVLIYLEGIKTPYNNQVAYLRDMYATANEISREDYKSGNYLIQGEPPKVRTVSVLQYANIDNIPSQDEVRKSVRDFYSKGFNATDIEFLTTVGVSTYFPHWDVERNSQGAQWDLFDLQGKYGIWFIGGGANWDLVGGIMEYNKLILRNIDEVQETCQDKPSQTFVPVHFRRRNSYG